MDDQNQLRIAQLLCSRLCHDLISPIGAINNGLELVSEDKSILDEAISLIGQSTQQASSRLAYYRLAFGGTDINEQTDFSQIQSLIQDFFGDGKVEISFGETFTPNEFLVSKLFAKLILNLSLVAAESLPRGGTMEIVTERSTGHRFHVSLAGRGCSLGDEVPNLLSGRISVADIDVKRVVPYLCYGIASQLGIGLNCDDVGADTARISST